MQKFTKIVINGREYKSIDQMPPDVRRQYLELMGTLGEDANHDGVPDVLQKPGSPNVIVKESIEFNGRKYNSRDELPPNVREILNRAERSQGEDDVTTLEVTAQQSFFSENVCFDRLEFGQRKTSRCDNAVAVVAGCRIGCCGAYFGHPLALRHETVTIVRTLISGEVKSRCHADNNTRFREKKLARRVETVESVGE
jgi:hypothetical protein